MMREERNYGEPDPGEDFTGSEPVPDDGPRDHPGGGGGGELSSIEPGVAKRRPELEPLVSGAIDAKKLIELLAYELHLGHLPASLAQLDEHLRNCRQCTARAEWYRSHTDVSAHGISGQTEIEQRRGGGEPSSWSSFLVGFVLGFVLAVGILFATSGLLTRFFG